MSLKFRVNEADLRAVYSRLDGIKNPQSALKQAINAAAKPVRDDLSKKAADVYVYGGGWSQIRAAAVIRNATASRPVAEIEFRSPVSEITKYKVSSKSVSTTRMTAKGKRVRRTLKGAVLRAGGIKPLHGATGSAFNVRFRSGHVSVVTRSPDEIANRFAGRKLTKHTQKLRVWQSPSIPKLIENEKVYGAEEARIREMIHEQVQNVIGRLVNG